MLQLLLCIEHILIEKHDIPERGSPMNDESRTAVKLNMSLPDGDHMGRQ